MAKADSPAAYEDVKHVLNLAVDKPGLRYELETPGKAMHFKQRCNRFRKMLRDMEQEMLAGVPGVRAQTLYDRLVIRQTNAEGKPDRRGTILVFDHESITGRLFDPETGEEIFMPNPFGPDLK